MGTDIHVILEVQEDDGRWYKVKNYQIEGFDFTDSMGYTDFPFNYRSYGLFGFLANIRNISCIPSITDHRGLPKDSVWLTDKVGEDYYGNDETNEQYIYDSGYYGYTWVLLSELLDYNYDQEFEDRRINKVMTNDTKSLVIYSGGNTVEEGEGRMISIRDFLGEYYFEQLEALKTFGEASKVRLLMYFDC